MAKVGRPKMESLCGQEIHNMSQAIDHATECCSVGVVREVTKHCPTCTLR